MDAETTQFFEFIEESLDLILSCGDGLARDGLQWTPDGPRTNSLQVIVSHSLANAERNVLAAFCGEPYKYDRDAEFRASEVSGAELHSSWDSLRVRMRASLAESDASWLTRECSHARLGMVPGRTVLLQAARHAAEHVGEARLTRALIERAR